MRTEQRTIYISDDGTEFRERTACEAYETQHRCVAEVMARIPKTELPNGYYTEHDPAILQEIKDDLWQLVLRYYGESYPEWRTWDVDKVNPLTSVVGRVLCDGHGPLTRAWYRLRCFDIRLGREYDQPYFALHPSEAKRLTSP